MAQTCYLMITWRQLYQLHQSQIRDVCKFDSYSQQEMTIFIIRYHMNDTNYHLNSDSKTRCLEQHSRKYDQVKKKVNCQGEEAPTEKGDTGTQEMKKSVRKIFRWVSFSLGCNTTNTDISNTKKLTCRLVSTYFFLSMLGISLFSAFSTITCMLHKYNEKGALQNSG